MSRAFTFAWIPVALLLPIFATHCAEATPPPGPGAGDDAYGGLGGDGNSDGAGGTDTGGGDTGGGGTGGTPPVSCEDGTVFCSGSCIVADNNTHCGGCYQGCFGGKTCVENDDGGFECVCPEGQLICSNACTDPLTSEAYCGASGSCLGDDAGESCGEHSICDDGACVCDASFTRCDDACVNTLTDPLHCTATAGECGVACAENEVCDNGACECPAGFAICNGACIDTQNDPDNCGGCNADAGSEPVTGSVCSGATPACGGGTCVTGPCDLSLTGSSSCTGVTMLTNSSCATGDDYFGATGLKCDNNANQIPKDTARCYTITGDYEDFRCWWSGRPMTVNGQTLSCTNNGSLIHQAAPRAGGYCVYIPPSSNDGAGTDGFSLGK